MLNRTWSPSELNSLLIFWCYICFWVHKVQLNLHLPYGQTYVLQWFSSSWKYAIYLHLEKIYRQKDKSLFIPSRWVHMMSHQWKQKWSEALSAIAPSSLTNGAAKERPLWVSCNFRQPLAGVGDLSSSQPSFSFASVSYLWPPSKVNVLPQVQINSTLTDQRPPLLLPLSTSTHTSPTTGEIRASLADLTAPLNATPDRSLIAWLNPLCPHHHLHSPSLIFALGQKQLLYSEPSSPILHSLTHTILPPVWKYITHCEQSLRMVNR